MKGSFRRSMIWLHTYSGLVLGWLIFAVWFSGTLSYFTPEITHWMRPEIANHQVQTGLVQQSFHVLQQRAPDAVRWQIRMPNPRDNRFELAWRNEGQSRREGTTLALNPHDFSIIEPRASDGGFFFRSFHYSLSLREYGGRYFTGIAAMLMLIAIFTGIFTHRRFFKDFFTLRFKTLSKGLTDSHALIGIITLPFCFVLGFSALLFYTNLYMPHSAELLAEGGYREIRNSVSTSLPPQSQSEEAAMPTSDVSKILNQIKNKWPEENAISYITYEQPYKANGRLVFWRNKTQLSSKSEVIAIYPHDNFRLVEVPEEPWVKQLNRVFIGMHEATFASSMLRWILFLLGLASSAMIATGLILWLEKKREKTTFSYDLVARLNVSSIGGLLLATVVFFYANRLLAVQIENREELEISAFFITWLGTFIISLILNHQLMWRWLLNFIGLAAMALPLVDYLVDPTYLTQAITQHNMIYLSFSLTVLICGLVCCAIAHYLKNKYAHAPSKTFQRIGSHAH